MSRCFIYHFDTLPQKKGGFCRYPKIEQYYKLESITWQFILHGVTQSEHKNIVRFAAFPFHRLVFGSDSFISQSNPACYRFITIIGHISFPKQWREWRLRVLFSRTNNFSSQFVWHRETREQHFYELVVILKTEIEFYPYYIWLVFQIDVYNILISLCCLRESYFVSGKFNTCKM